MKYMYAALLLHSAGRDITEASLESILAVAGVQPDEMRVKALIAALAEIDIDEAIKAPFFATPASPPVVEEEPEEPEEIEEVEEEDTGLSALFG